MRVRTHSTDSRLLSLIGALLLLVAQGRAQVAATISGRVEDRSGAAVRDATITVKSLESGTRRTVNSDSLGNFRVLSLPLGKHEVKAERVGFRSVVRTGIELEVGQEAVVKLQLEVGDLLQQVTVSEGTPVVNTTTSPVSGLVGEREVKDLPLNGRSFDNLITLNPGTINYSAMKSAQTSTSNGNTFSVAGRRPSENLFLLNGVEYMGSSQLANTPGGASGQLLGIEAVREFNVLTDTYSAEYGKRAGAQVSVVTQSGTNTLHGTVFEFIRNSALDARNYFDQGPAPPFRRNQFGGALGGPIKKDSLFMFGNYEGFRQALAFSNVSVVPDDLARRGLLPNASGAYVPVAGFAPAMLDYMSFWPAPNGPELLINGRPSGTALAFNNPRQSIREEFGTVRGDYSLRDKDTLSGVYTVDDGNNLSPLSNPLFGSIVRLRMQVASLRETHVLSSRALNTFTAGFSRAAFNFDPVLRGSFPSNTSFVRGAGPGGIVIGGGATTTGAAAITAAGPNNASNVWNRRNLFTLTDSVQISQGIHQISTGVWFQRLQDNENSASRQLGQATFASLTTFLQGTVSSFQAVPNPTELGWRTFFGAWYFQDAIKLLPNLTLQPGIRHEFTTGWNEVSGRAANYVTDAQGVLETTPRVANSAFSENRAKRLISLRVNLAWDPFKDGKTAIRAGFGTYYSLIDALSFLLNSLPPYNGSVSFSNVSLSSFLPIVPGVQPVPSCGPGVPSPCTIYAPQGVQADARTPTAQEWRLTLERQLGQGTALRVAYVGSHSYHLLLSVDPNSIPARICSSAGGCQSGGVGAARSTVPMGAEYIPVGSRPNPFLSGGFFWHTAGNSSYNALQLEVTRRLSKGLQFRTNYTWSKNLDINSGLTGAQSNNQAQMVLDRNNLRRDWGPSAMNITHQAGIAARYELPFGKRKRGMEGTLLNNWELNGIATLLSGFPFTPQIGSNRSGDGDTRNPDRPSLNPAFTGPIVLERQNQWFNPNAFVLPPAGTYGNLGRGTFVGPALAQVDLSLSKSFELPERATLQFRAEAFNLLNHTNLGTPNAIVFSGGAISPSAGLITSTATTSRQIQFGLKLSF